jgi:hypothetical protein
MVSWCCPSCSGCCAEPVKASKQLGGILISSDGFIEPYALMMLLSPAQRQIFVRLGINSPRPISMDSLMIYDSSSYDSLKTTIARIRPIISEYHLNIIAYRGYGYAMEIANAI